MEPLVQRRRELFVWQLAGFAAVSLLGTLLHFLYEWLPSPITALFSGVNESTWEHMKLLYFPMMAVALVQGRFLARRVEGFACIKLRGTVLGLLLIPVLFYTSNGMLGPTPDYINIAIFFVSAGLAYLYEWKSMSMKDRSCHRLPAMLLLALLGLCFFVFTYRPPALPLFTDPRTGGLGLPA